jgi:hypothetical protein
VSDEIKTKRTLWDHPWGYGESFVIAAELLIFGFIIEFITRGKGLAPISMPYNFYLLAAYAGILIYLRIFKFQHPVVKWLTGVPAAISSIVTFGLITLLMGFIPQTGSDGSRFIDLIGLTHLKNGWPILFCQLFLLTSLGLVCLKRIFPFNIKNTGFILNHFGLWLTLVAALLGSGDLKRLSINLLEEGKENNIAIGQHGEAYKLPFDLKLLDFHIDEYVPQLVLVDPHTGKFIQKKGDPLITIEQGKTYKLEDWSITVDKFVEDAVPQDSVLIDDKVNGSFPAAFVKIKNLKDGNTFNGWLGAGSFLYNPVFIYLTPEKILALSMPQPKKFRSEVVITQSGIAPDTVTIEVNKPYDVAGWKVYQLSYDENKGKWSTLSVLEVVSDPWIKIVYTGIFLMLAGSVFLFWTGRKRVKIQS